MLETARRMKYHSTRDSKIKKSFEEVLVATYASDGGMYVPEKLPLLTTQQLAEWSLFSFQEICAEVVHLFTNYDKEDLNQMSYKAFSNFNNDGIDPLPMQQVGQLIFLDASLGPTLAFKDIGQQMVAQLLNYVLGKQQKKATIMIETSGDTGPAAISAVRNCPYVDIICLYPHGRVSRVQELQMTTVASENVKVYGTEGSTDEQAIVLKEIFQDVDFIEKYSICSVNSINWTRIMVQSSYYIWSYLQIYNTKFSIGKHVNYIIPTGAFGNAMGCFLGTSIGNSS